MKRKNRTAERKIFELLGKITLILIVFINKSKNKSFYVLLHKKFHIMRSLSLGMKLKIRSCQMNES